MHFATFNENLAILVFPSAPGVDRHAVVPLIWAYLVAFSTRGNRISFMSWHDHHGESALIHPSPVLTTPLHPSDLRIKRRSKEKIQLRVILQS